MHILIAILGALAAGAYWWYSAKNISSAANDVADAVGRVRGNFRRSAMKKKAAISPIAAIDDPVVAAAAVMTAIAAEDAVVTPELEQRVRLVLSRIADGAKADEAMTYAKWATDQVADVPVVIDTACAFLAERLNEREKEDLVAMVGEAALDDERHNMYPHRIDRLRKKLGLTVR